MVHINMPKWNFRRKCKEQYLCALQHWKLTRFNLWSFKNLVKASWLTWIANHSPHQYAQMKIQEKVQGTKSMCTTAGTWSHPKECTNSYFSNKWFSRKTELPVKARRIRPLEIFRNFKKKKHNVKIKNCIRDKINGPV